MPSSSLPHPWKAAGFALSLIASIGMAGCGKAPQGEFHAYGTSKEAVDAKQAADEVSPRKDENEPKGENERPEVRVAEATPEAAGAAKSDDKTAPGDPAAVVAGVQTERERPQRVSPRGPVVDFPNEPALAEMPARKIELLVPEKKFRTEKGALRVTFEDLDLLKVLNMDPVTPEAIDYMPPWMKSLEGQRVRIQGFMTPQYVAEGIKRFVFTRDTGVCCFGPNPTIYYLIDVHMKPGTSADYIENRRFEVVGTFHFRPSGNETTLDELYRIDDAEIIAR